MIIVAKNGRKRLINYTSTVMRSTPAGNVKLLISSCSYGKICAFCSNIKN